MNRSAWVHVGGLLVVASSVLIWYATGAEGYTRWPDARLEQADALPVAGEADLLADVGFTDQSQEQNTPKIQSRFALGLVPGGVDPPHLLSVALMALGAIGVSGAVAGRSLFVSRRSFARSRQETYR